MSCGTRESVRSLFVSTVKTNQSVSPHHLRLLGIPSSFSANLQRETYFVTYPELQIRGANRDNSKIIFLSSQRKRML